LPPAGRGRPRHTPHPRPREPRALRTRRRVGGQLRLPGGCAPRAGVLRGHSPLLARSPRRRARARLRGCAAADLGPGEPLADFRIDDVRTHGVPGLINLFGIESPGLTASLAIAEEVVDRLRSGTAISTTRTAGPRAPLGPRCGARVSWRGWPPPGSRASR